MKHYFGVIFLCLCLLSSALQEKNSNYSENVEYFVENCESFSFHRPIQSNLINLRRNLSDQKSSKTRAAFNVLSVVENEILVKQIPENGNFSHIQPSSMR